MAMNGNWHVKALFRRTPHDGTQAAGKREIDILIASGDFGPFDEKKMAEECALNLSCRDDVIGAEVYEKAVKLADLKQKNLISATEHKKQETAALCELHLAQVKNDTDD
jgi:hypothetical protein